MGIDSIEALRANKEFFDQKLFKDPARVCSGRNCASLRTASL